jgi:hypothetical protein
MNMHKLQIPVCFDMRMNNLRFNIMAARQINYPGRTILSELRGYFPALTELMAKLPVYPVYW